MTEYKNNTPHNDWPVVKLFRVYVSERKVTPSGTYLVRYIEGRREITESRSIDRTLSVIEVTDRFYSGPGADTRLCVVPRPSPTFPVRASVRVPPSIILTSGI